MAKLKSEELELEFEFPNCAVYELDEYTFRCTLRWNGIPVLNGLAMKQGLTNFAFFTKEL